MDLEEEANEGPPPEVAAVPDGGGADSRELTVPPAVPGLMHMCIEYPGYVGDEDRVLETLGGTAGLARQLQENPKTLALKFRPQDRNCHATYGLREGSRRLLVKLTRPAAGNSAAGINDGAGDGDGGSSGASAGSAAGGWTAEVVAALHLNYRFSQPADFQYVALDSRPVEEQGLDQQQDASLPGFQPQPLLCAPPLFAKQPLFDYAFRGYKAVHAPGASVQAGTTLAGSAVKRKGGSGVMASFFDLEVPQPLPEAALAAAARYQGPALRLLRQLLQHRPVWPPAALHEAFAHVAAAAHVPDTEGGRSAVDELLPKLCYKFRNGPWKNAWTRRGFDPRTAPAARQWQCLEYHLPADWYAKIAERRKKAAAEREAAAEGGSLVGDTQQEQEQQQQQQAGKEGGGGGDSEGPALPPLATSYRQLARFEAVPATQSCSLQLGLLADSVVHEVLEDPENHAQHCSDASGWLSSHAFDSIKRRIKERFLALLDGAPIQDDFEPPEAVQAAALEALPSEDAAAAQQVQQAGQEGGGDEEARQGRGKAKRKGKGKGKQRQAEVDAEGGQQAQQQGQAAEAMEVDGTGAAEPAVPAARAGQPSEVEQLAQQAQQMRIQQGAEEQQAGAGEGGEAEAAGARAGAAAGSEQAQRAQQAQQQGVSILPTGLLASVADYLAHLPEEDQAEEEAEEAEDAEEEGEEEEGEGFQTDEGEGFQTDEGEGYGTDEGYQTEEGGAAGGEHGEEER